VKNIKKSLEFKLNCTLS